MDEILTFNCYKNGLSAKQNNSHAGSGISIE